MRAAVDQACSRSIRPLWAAAEPLTAHNSARSDPVTLGGGEGEGRREAIMGK